MFIGGIYFYSKMVTLSYKSLRTFMTFYVGIFFKILVTYFTKKVSTNWCFFFYDAKSGKWHSPEKQHFSSVLALYNVWGCFSPPFQSHSG